MGFWINDGKKAGKRQTQMLRLPFTRFLKQIDDTQSRDTRGDAGDAFEMDFLLEEKGGHHAVDDHERALIKWINIRCIHIIGRCGFEQQIQIQANRHQKHIE